MFVTLDTYSQYNYHIATSLIYNISDILIIPHPNELVVDSGMRSVRLSMGPGMRGTVGPIHLKPFDIFFLKLYTYFPYLTGLRSDKSR